MPISKNGADWCNYGWSEGQLALYPTQEDSFAKLELNPETRGQCGLPGVNGGYFENKNLKFGANCYGEKPEPSGSQQDKLLQEQYLLNPLLVKHRDIKHVFMNLKYHLSQERNGLSTKKTNK